MNERSKGLSSLAASAAAMPLEAMLPVKKRHKELFIGIPKETSFQENRIPLIPDSVSLLVNRGHEIIIEAGAGAASKIEDSVKRELVLYIPLKKYIKLTSL
jgi:alanine dehydrogenase